VNSDGWVVPDPEELEDLVTGGAIAKRLVMSRARVHQLAARPDFPKPLGRIGQSKVWRWSDIRAWLPAVGRPPVVEIYSATDPINVPDRRVWYWVEINEERQGERTESYQEAAAVAEKLREQLDTVIIDRSDRGSGYLLSTLRPG
jgi:predicted DNA-binding transcriptional regulator AlpA